MPKKIGEKSIIAIKDHISYTSGFMIKAYSLKELSFLDGIDTKAVKKSGKYIPVRIDGGYSKYKYERGDWKKPYRVLYVRVDEIKHIFRKRNDGKTIS